MIELSLGARQKCFGIIVLPNMVMHLEITSFCKNNFLKLYKISFNYFSLRIFSCSSYLASIGNVNFGLILPEMGNTGPGT